MLQRNAAAVCALVMGLWAGAPSQADDTQPSRARLEAINKEVTQRRTQADKLALEIAETRREHRALQKQLVEAASAIHVQEQKLAAVEARTTTLAETEQGRLKELQAKLAGLADLVGVMQRLSRQPTTLLIARPTDMATTARTALLLDSVTPVLAAEAAALRADVTALAALRSDLATERSVLDAERAELEQQRNNVSALMGEKKKRETFLAKALASEKKRLAALAREAQSLNELLQKIEAARPSLKDTKIGRPLDSLPFSSAKGSLPFPAQGDIVSRYSRSAARGPLSRGIQLETRPQAQVISPWDGEVVFSGRFRDYGQLLIISHGEGYHTLLAGMGQLDVGIAQWVLAGEPVGQMGPVRVNTSQASQDGHNDLIESRHPKPRLYLELRLNGRSINPLPWLAASNKKVKG